ncbi:MAG TPA: N-acetylmuramoyl-L-alanine amidase-like domain-containing protein [Anaeromyxobacteraceae bacterium]|nr:N-acetylmuramoyl-L-alanine amidase-like domain-containing protein [Anaeromyxobacteraceae bacterium]
MHISLHLAALALGVAHPEAALDEGLLARPAGAERALWASALLAGAPYRLSPLGEGAGPDPDPRFRLDAFDCVTFVETALALSAAGSVAQAARLLDDVRYAGPPDFAHRNHYVEAQWLPSLVEKGWIEPATRRVAPESAVRVEKRLDAALWRAAERAGHVLPDLPPSRRPAGTFAIDMLPLPRAREMAPRLEPGLVLLVIREDRADRPYRVSHMGLVVADARGRRYLRHASDVPRVMKVRDEPLDAFLSRHARQTSWPVTGVSLWAIRDATARARTLLGPEAGPPRAPVER